MDKKNMDVNDAFGIGCLVVLIVGIVLILLSFAIF